MNYGSVNIHSIAGLDRLVRHLSSASGRLDAACHALRSRAERQFADAERRLDEAVLRFESADAIRNEAIDRLEEERQREREEAQEEPEGYES